MIKNKIVFILGAGASVDLNFPTGKELKNYIVELLNNETNYNQIFSQFGFEKERVFEFRNRLRDSPYDSVDAFLECAPDFIDIGKVAIAFKLVSCESKESFWDGENWYKYLFKKMKCGPDINSFSNNNVRFVTFNYDRSIEYFFFNSLKSLYNSSDEKIKSVLKDLLPIHVHGQLGYLPWQDFGTDESREYDSKTSDYNALKIAAKGIQIMQFANENSANFVKARQIINDYHYVVFLGFGYYEKNIERLKLDLRRNSYFGTCVKLLNEQINDINRMYFNNSLIIRPDADTCLKFLQTEFCSKLH